MMSGNRKIGVNIITVLMMVLLHLPCSAKREIKQFLNIPVAQSEYSVKPNKVSFCQNYTQERTLTTYGSAIKKSIPKLNNPFFFECATAIILQHPVHSFASSQYVANIPIYILHEQYLI